LRLPSARIKAAAGSSVGCGRFVFSSLTVAHLEEKKPPEGFFRGRGRCCLRWERGASTLEERKPSRFSAYQRENFPFDISKVAPLPRQGFPVFVCTKTQLAILSF